MYSSFSYTWSKKPLQVHAIGTYYTVSVPLGAIVKVNRILYTYYFKSKPLSKYGDKKIILYNYR